MLVTLLPIVTEVKPVQPEKALSPMLVTLLGIVTEVKPVQLAKALFLILMTLLGIEYAPFFSAGYKINSVLSLLNNTPSIEL